MASVTEVVEEHSSVGERINTRRNDDTETQSEPPCRPETTGNQIKVIKSPEGRRKKMQEVTGVRPDLGQGRNGHESQEPGKGSPSSEEDKAQREAAKLQRRSRRKISRRKSHRPYCFSSLHEDSRSHMLVRVTKGRFLLLPGNVLWYIQDSDKGQKASLGLQR